MRNFESLVIPGIRSTSSLGLGVYLARAEFDDELLVQFFVLAQARIGVAAARNALQHTFRRLGTSDFQEIGDRFDVGRLIQLHLRDALWAILDRDLVALLDDDARDVAMLAVQHDMAVRHQLTSGGPRWSESEAMHDVVEPAFENAQERLAGILFRASRQGEIAAELALEDAVEPFELLLFAQTVTVLRLLAATGMHSGGLITPFDGAFGAFAARALQVELNAFAAAESANWINVTSHGSRLFLLNEIPLPT
jgi:hypothetical protein